MNHTKPFVLRVMAGIAAAGLTLGAVATASDHDQAPTSAGSEPVRQRQSSVEPPSEPASRPESEVVPETLDIPGLGVHQSLLELGVTSSGELEVPSMADADQPGWYKHSVAPGEQGPAVIAGHVDTRTGPAVFFDLRSMQVGDSVEVTRSDGMTAVFEVTKVRSHDKDAFPTDAVYGPVKGEELRLITCGGDFQPEKGSYEQNLIVFATLQELVPTSAVEGDENGEEGNSAAP